MKVRSRLACISAAVAAFMCATASGQVRNLTWDANGDADPRGQDGGGTWNTDPTALNFVDGDLVTGTNVAWTNTPGDSATFGNATNAVVNGVVHNIEIGAPITVQNLVLGVGTDGGIYNISSFTDGGSLTVAGNITKIASGGQPQFLLFAAPLTLTAGDHVFALRDTPGPVAEMLINGQIAGDGSVRLDNGVYEAWGTLAFNADNTYTGVTNIDKGRLIITTAGGLGSTAAGTTISNQGTLSIGGAGTTVPGGSLTITEPITIQRSVYAGGEFDRYRAAVIFENGTGTHTMTAPLVIDSTDARIAVNTSTLVLPGGNIALGPNGATGVLSFTGDYAGFVELQGSNPALATNGIKLVNAVEVRVNSHDALGGPSAPITFSGDATLGIMNGFMTDFGTHVVNYDSFSGGLHIPEGNVFNLTQAITGGAGMGKRGTGTLNFNAPVTRTAGVGNGGIFWDGGVVNINANHTVGALHLRDPIVNIADGVTVTTNGDYSSLGQDNGDTATVNILGSATLFANTGADFNVSDNGGSSGTINIPANGTLTVNGKLFLSKNNNTHATINQDGGTVNANRTGDASLAIGQGGGSDGKYFKNAGTLKVAGEWWIGNAGGTGVYTQLAGPTTVNNWFVVGRDGATGTLNISGGSLTRLAGGNGGNHNYVGQLDNKNSAINISGTGSVSIETGQFWLGNAGSSKGTLNIADSGSFTVTNNWLAVGRNGTAQGEINLSGSGSLTKTGTGTAFTIGSGGGGSGVVNQTGATSTLTSAETYVGENGTGVMNLSAGAASLGVLRVGLRDNGNGTLNISNAAAATAGNAIVGNANTAAGTVNLNGGSLTVASINGGASTGAKTLNFNGGTLRAGADSTAFMGGLTAANVKNPGAIIDTNGFSVTAAQALVADGTGGLTKNGAGTLTLNGVNTYTGPTSATGGKTVLGKSLTRSSSVSVSNDAEVEVANDGTYLQVIQTGPIAIGAESRIDLTNNKLITTTDAGTFNGTSYTGVQGEVARAYNFGSWDTPGLTTSEERAGQNAGPLSGTTTIGVNKAQAVLFLENPADTGIFAGQTVTGSDTLAVYTYAGDMNFDGLVDGADYGIIDNSVQFPGTDGYMNGDLNYDGVIDGADYGIIDNTIQLQGDPIPMGTAFASGASLSGVTAVPEPASLSAIGLAAAGLLGRRRRRRTS